MSETPTREHEEESMERLPRREDEQRQKMMSRLTYIIIGQLVVYLITIGIYINQINQNTKDIAALQVQMNEVTSIKENIVKLNTQMDTVSNLLNSMAGTLKEVAYRGQRNIPTLERANRFMDEHIKEHARMNK